MTFASPLIPFIDLFNYLVPKLQHIHHWRILNYAAFETLATFLIAVIIVRYTTPASVGRCVMLRKWLMYIVLLIIIAVTVHWHFGVNTELNWQLGIAECPPNYDSLTGIFSCRDW